MAEQTVYIYNDVSVGTYQRGPGTLQKGDYNAVIVEMIPQQPGTASLTVTDSTDPNTGFNPSIDPQALQSNKTQYTKALLTQLLPFANGQLVVASGIWTIKYTALNIPNSEVVTVSGTVDQGLPAGDANGWPVKVTDGANGEAGISVDGGKHALNAHITGSDIAAGGTSAMDEAAWTAGISTLTPAGGVFNDTAPVLTSGQQGTQRLTAQRGAHVNLRTAAGVELPATATPAAGAGTGITEGLQVDPLGGMTIAQAAVNVAASGSTQIVAGVAGKIIYVLHWFLVAAGTVNATWEDGAAGALTGAVPLVANSGVSAGSGAGVVLKTTTAGDALELNLSAAVQVSGVVVYGVK